MKATFAVVGLTVRALIRSRWVVVTAIFLLGFTLILPWMLRDDGTAVGRARVWIQYQFHLMLLGLSVATLGAGPGLVAGERERRHLQQILVKPVPFVAVWLGKWLALCLINGVLLLGSFGLFFFMMVRSFGSGRLPSDQTELRNRVWTVRRLTRPVAGTRWVEGEGMGVWRLEMPTVSAGKPLLLRARFFSPAVVSRWTIPGEWEIRDPEGRMYYYERLELRPGVVQEISLPAPSDTIAAGVWEVRYRNLDRDTILFDEEKSVTLWSEAGCFATNLLRGLALIWFRLLLLAAAGLTMGTLFSTPVAIFMSTFLLLLILLSGQIGWVVRTGQLVEPPHTHGGEPCTEHHSTPLREAVERGLKGMYRFLDRAVGAVRDFDPVEQAAESSRIEVQNLLRGFFQLVVLRGGILGLLAVLAATHLEWG